MPTIHELYDRLIKPTLEEKAAKEFYRQKKHEQKMSFKDSVIIDPNPDCVRNGHQPIKHTMMNAENGNTFAQCYRCKQPYILPKTPDV